MYRKLRRVWSHNDFNYIPNFKELFPELRNVSSEEMCDRWSELGIDFYTEEKDKTPVWIRFTLPFAILIMAIMVILSPINFLFTGKWGYSIGGSFMYNWFRALRLM